MKASEQTSVPSASERLRELGREHASDEPFELTRQEAVEGALIRALPLIADVVEAAERAREYADTGYSDKAGAVLRREAGPALTALTAALEGGGDA